MASISRALTFTLIAALAPLHAGCDSAASGKDKPLETIDAYIAEQKIDKSDDRWKQKLPEPPKVEFDAAKKYIWKLETNKGPIEIQLNPKVAPEHVASTMYLTRLGFYDNVVFHRIIPGFMAQGGDPTGSGRGGPGYQYEGEFDASAKHDKRGILSMANAGPGTDGSQFFLTFGPTPNLDGKHTVFGEITSGDATLGELEKSGSPRGETSEKLEIVKATVRIE